MSSAMPFDTSAYNNYLATFTGQSIVKVSSNNMPNARPPLLNFPQQSFAIPQGGQGPFTAPPINVAPWNDVNGGWNSQQVQNAPPPFPHMFQANNQPQSHQFLMPQPHQVSPQPPSPSPYLPNNNMSAWPPLPTFVMPSLGNKQKPMIPNGQTQHGAGDNRTMYGSMRAVSAPPPVEFPTETLVEVNQRQVLSQLRFILEKMMPLNFDSTSGRIRKLLTTDKVITETDHFNEAVRLIVDRAIAISDQTDDFNMYINLIKSLSKLDFAPSEDAKPVNFLNTAVNHCFSVLNIRGSHRDSESDGKDGEKEPAKVSKELIKGSKDDQKETKFKMIGSIRIIASLFKAKEISKGTIVDCVNRLIRADDENCFLCIHKLLTLVGREFDEAVKAQKDKQHWWSNLFDTFKVIERRPTTSPKTRALFQEILEAKEENWNFPQTDESQEFSDEVNSILETLPVSMEANEVVEDRFAKASKRFRALMPIAERRPYLFTEITDALLNRLSYYHKEILGSDKSVVDTQVYARMRIENEVMLKNKQIMQENAKSKETTITNLLDKVTKLEQQIETLKGEVANKSKVIEQQQLHEAQYRSTVQQAFDAKVEEFRKQLAIQLQAYIGNK